MKLLKDMTVDPVIVIPIYRLPLTQEEEISLHQLNSILGDYPRVVCGPDTLSKSQLEKYGSTTLILPERHFRSTNSYSKLLMSSEFYEELSTWTHVLIYQLDCLVFRDELLHWCSQEWDYIGAPWFKGYDQCINQDVPWAVGNGGFSLRNIKTFLSTLRMPSPERVYLYPYLGNLPENMEEVNGNIGLFKKMLPSYELLPLIRPEWTVEQEAQKYWYNEDAFWSFEALKFNPDFRIPSVKKALEFAFELEPSTCLQLNNQRLPFGCHAWAKYDRGFWDAILSKNS